MKRILGLLLIGMMVASVGFGQKKMEDITIRFFAGGDAGDPFASIDHSHSIRLLNAST